MWGAFLIGLLGSLHCVGMCGAITMMVPRRTGGSQLLPVLQYNAGRIGMYALLGILAGLAGEGLIMAGVQKYITLSFGILLLLIAGAGRSFHAFPLFSKATKALQPVWNRVLHRQGLMTAFYIGLLNGLIPCGMVYIALGGALIAGSLTGSIFFMVFFGLGTAPAMILTYLTGHQFIKRWKVKFPAILNAAMILSGLLLIYRALYTDLYASLTGISQATPLCH